MNKFCRLVAALLLPLISAPALAVTNAEVFAYAAATYPSLFSGTPSAGQYQQYAYQYYPASGNYLALDTAGTIFVLGPFTHNAITAVGPASAYAGAIAAWESSRGVATYWTPGLNDTWQLQLRGTPNIGYAVKVYDIDLFDTPQATIDTLKTQGKRVVCYFSAGSSENWRSDFNRFAAGDMGKDLSGWPGERWLDTRSANVRVIMQTRLDLASSKGCDGVDPDNVDGYANDSGFALDASTQLDYDSFIAAEAHARGLAVGLKNDIGQIDTLAAQFDFAVNEQCFYYGECGAYRGFTALGKPVFNVEYAAAYQQNTGGARDALCQSAKAANIRTLVLPLMLDDTSRYSCD